MIKGRNEFIVRLQNENAAEAINLLARSKELSKNAITAPILERAVFDKEMKVIKMENGELNAIRDFEEIDEYLTLSYMKNIRKLCHSFIKSNYRFKDKSYFTGFIAILVDRYDKLETLIRKEVDFALSQEMMFERMYTDDKYIDEFIVEKTLEFIMNDREEILLDQLNLNHIYDEIKVFYKIEETIEINKIIGIKKGWGEFNLEEDFMLNKINFSDEDYFYSKVYNRLKVSKEEVEFIKE